MASADRIVPTIQNPDIVSLEILIEGNAVSKKYQFVSITILHGINKIPTAHLQILDGEPNKEDFEISDSGEFKPGKKIEIQLGYHDEKDTVFKGIIISNSHRITDNCAELNIECKDEVVKMTISRNNHHFNNILDSEIVEQLLDNNGLVDYKVDKSSVKHEQLVQSNITDWDFMISRIDVNGMICLIDNGRLNIIKPNLDADAKLDLTYGADIIEFNADMDSRVQTSNVKTFTWDFINQKVQTVESGDSGIKEEGDLSASQLASVSSQPFEMRTSAPMTLDEQQALTDSKKMKQALSKIKAKVKYQGINIVLPGDFINIHGAGKNFNGKAFVSAIQHEYSEGDWITEATLGWNELFFTEQTDPTHAASQTGQSSSIQGLQTGIVTDIKDPSGQYRVRVRLPMVNENDEGIYARVATLDAGEKRGTFFRPEIDDEVVVGFMNDDPRHPVILGMLNSSAKPAPLEPDPENPKKGYQSRSGIKLFFDDDKKSVLIETPDSRVFELNDNGASITLRDKKGNKMKINSSGINIESASDLTIKAQKSISISAAQVSLKADASMSIEGSSSASVNSSGITEIKGSLVKIN